jgi:hypothetical protein
MSPQRFAPGLRYEVNYLGGFSFASPVPSGVLYFGDEALYMEEHNPLPGKKCHPRAE